MNLLDHLQEAGYEPQETTTAQGEWYDLTVPGTGTVRVVVDPADGYRVDIHVFDQYMVCRWSATMSPGTPDPAIIAFAKAAESQLAARDA